MCQQFANSLKAFFDWVAQQKASTADQTSELEKQLQVINQAIASQSEADGKLKSLDELAAKIVAAEIAHNKYTNNNAGDARTSYQTFQTVLSKRKVLLESEIKKKQDKVRLQFSKKKNLKKKIFPAHFKNPFLILFRVSLRSN